MHIFRVALAVGLGVATVLLMDATNTSYFGWYRCAQRSSGASRLLCQEIALCIVASVLASCPPRVAASRALAKVKARFLKLGVPCSLTSGGKEKTRGRVRAAPSTLPLA